MKHKKCVELYSSECCLSPPDAAGGAGSSSSVISLESPEGGKGLVHFVVSHANCPKLNLRLVKANSKSPGGRLSTWLGGIAGVSGRGRRRASIALSETPIDLFALTSFANSNNDKGAAAAAGQSTSSQIQV